MAWGDRCDGKLVRNLNHFKSSYIGVLPSRIEAQTYFSFSVEVDKLLEFVRQKNSANKPRRYKVFYVILAAIVRLLSVRKYLNNFISNSNVYERDAVYTSFAIKRSLSDENSDETVAKLRFDYGATLDDIIEVVDDYINRARKVDKSDDKVMKAVNALPSFMKRIFWAIVRYFDRHGWLPKSLVDIDPLHSSVMVANMGSIGMNTNFHHLYEFGTISAFICIGKIRTVNNLDSDGHLVTKNIMDISITIDERLADGLYYLNSMKMFEDWLKNPEKLEEEY